MCDLEMKHVAIPIVGNLEILGVETASRWVFSKHVAMIRVLTRETGGQTQGG